jgi:hypothetical protein
MLAIARRNWAITHATVGRTMENNTLMQWMGRQEERAVIFLQHLCISHAETA